MEFIAKIISDIGKTIFAVGLASVQRQLFIPFNDN
jgi:hypothetical protein